MASAGGRATEPTGDVSVMPHACSTDTWWSFSNACISDGGTAAPPMSTSRIDEMSCGWCSRCRCRPCQIVGTAAANVGRSAAMSSASGPGCRNRSGMISDAPIMNAA